MSKAPVPTFDSERLSAADKVTALLLTMSKQSADSIIKRFDNREIRLIAQSATALPAVPDEAIETLINDLYDALASSGGLAGSPKEAEQLLSGVLSEEQISDIFSEVSGPSPERVWAKLDDVREERIAQFITGEQPQVAAAVLSQLDPSKAAAVLEKLGHEQRIDLSRRLLAMKPISNMAMNLIAERLRDSLLGEVIAVEGTGDRYSKLAAILNKLERQQIEEILVSIEASSQADAELVKSYVFTFEDIAGMEPEDRARLMDEVPVERTVMSLRGAPAELLDVILEALSPRSRRIVSAELGTDGRVPPKAIGEARRWIAALALSMAERSLIKLRPQPHSQVPEQ
ncbi:MAG TPA: FliG C-terminal domain-containing protein [Hyphomicrobiaceae bacterium]|nr:FliG C-terminal domain-containing protein [Hyphomicrobiaceae bacterium]